MTDLLCLRYVFDLQDRSIAGLCMLGTHRKAMTGKHLLGLQNAAKILRARLGVLIRLEASVEASGVR